LHKTPLNTASDLVAQLGAQAEMLAGDHVEAALAAGNQEDFQFWSLVAKAVVLLTRQPAPTDIPKPEPAAASQPAEEPVRVAWRARA
jgi:hypothetical protein